MQNQKRKKAACRYKRPSFTFLESLLNLLIVFIIASFLPLFYQALSKAISLSELTKASEWFLFHSQIVQETKNKPILLNNQGSLCFPEQNKEICYERKNQVYRRQVDGKGHEILLTHLKNIHVIENVDTFTLHFIFINKSEKELRLPKQGALNE